MSLKDGWVVCVVFVGVLVVFKDFTGEYMMIYAHTFVILLCAGIFLSNLKKDELEKVGQFYQAEFQALYVTRCELLERNLRDFGYPDTTLEKLKPACKNIEKAELDFYTIQIFPQTPRSNWVERYRLL